MKKNKRKKMSVSNNIVKIDDNQALKNVADVPSPKEKAKVSFSNIGNAKAIVKEQRIEIRQGPLPSPEILQCYNDINGNFAEIIVNMAVKEQDKSIEAQRNEFEIQKMAINSVLRGRLLGTLLILSLVGLAAYALFLGQDWVARFLVKALFAVVAIATLGIGGVFLKSKQKK